jgi:hypothetical protein
VSLSGETRKKMCEGWAFYTRSTAACTADVSRPDLMPLGEIVDPVTAQSPGAKVHEYTTKSFSAEGMDLVEVKGLFGLFPPPSAASYKTD